MGLPWKVVMMAARGTCSLRGGDSGEMLFQAECFIGDLGEWGC